MQDNSPLLYRAEQMLRYLRNEMTMPDSEAFEDWLSRHPTHQQFIAGLSEEQGMEDIMAFLSATERAEAWASLQQKLNLSGNKGKGIQFKGFPLWKKIAVAAAVFIVIGAGLYFYTNEQSKNKITIQDLAVNDIIAGGNKAYLTLADGKKIVLTDIGNGKVAEQAGLSITKTAEGQLLYEVKEATVAEKNKEQILYNTIATPAGGQYQVVLPDGTHVWLNAASSLTYATSLANLKERKVELNGEAYFEVARQEKDQVKKPFIVKSRNQEVEVLGTHFNISSYEQETLTATTLLEGRVKVSRQNAFEETISPGEQSLVGKGIAIAKVDTSTAVAWKNGLFRFENANIYTVMNQFSRWYNFDVKYEGKIPTNKFNGEIYRNLNASKALKILSYSKIKFSVESNSRNPERKTIVITSN
jgi:transmembrane sensor